MAQRNPRAILLGALARWLKIEADFINRQAGRAERLAAQAQPGDKAVDETAAQAADEPFTESVAAPASGQAGKTAPQASAPPAHWLERVNRAGPPAHWQEYVRKKAPGLLDAEPLSARPLDAKESSFPQQPAPEEAGLNQERMQDRNETAPPTQRARQQAEQTPLHLIPRGQPTGEGATEALAMEELAAQGPAVERPAPEATVVEEVTAEQPAPKAPARGPTLHEQRRPVPGLRLQTQPRAMAATKPEKGEAVPGPEVPSHHRQQVPRAPAEEQAVPPSAYPAFPEEEGTTPQTQRQPPAPQRSQPRLRHWVAERERDETEGPTRSPWPSLPQETASQPVEPGGSREPIGQRSRTGTENWQAEGLERHWPALPDAAGPTTDTPQDWEAELRAWRRLQRLYREQRGCLWSELPS